VALTSDDRVRAVLHNFERRRFRVGLSALLRWAAPTFSASEIKGVLGFLGRPRNCVLWNRAGERSRRWTHPTGYSSRRDHVALEATVVERTVAYDLAPYGARRHLVRCSRFAAGVVWL
jgi:hypothetical protein